MSNSNQYVTWATGAGANVAASPAAYAAMAIRQLGAQLGIADPVSFNSAMRQASVVATMIAQFIADYGESNVNDDGNVATLEEQFLVALQGVIQTEVGAQVSSPGVSPVKAWLTRGSYTYTPTTNGIDLVFVTGGGGGGGAASNTNQFSGAGGGAGETRIKIVARVANQSTAIVVAAGGLGNPYGNTTNYGLASSGGSSSFGTVMTSMGGYGGVGSAVAAGGGYGAGAPNCATGSGGDIVIPGGPGTDGNIFSAESQGGNGGSSLWGNGMKGSIPSASGNVVGAAWVPGSGGGGAWGSGPFTGGAGADGAVVIIPLA